MNKKASSPSYHLPATQMTWQFDTVLSQPSEQCLVDPGMWKLLLLQLNKAIVMCMRHYLAMQ